MHFLKTFIVTFFLMLAEGIAGQDSTELFIQAGRTVSEVLTPDKIYQHSQFVLGKVLYRNGTETEALLNYNYISGNIEFIDSKNDTLVIAREQVLNIEKIIINGHTYLNNRVYFEKVEENALGKLLKRQMFAILKREKIGAYNQSTSLSSILSPGVFTDGNGAFNRDLKVNENITLALVCDYFFSNQNGILLPATKKNIIKTYPSKKRQIEDYLKQHRVDFKNIEDLKKLFSSL